LVFLLPKIFFKYLAFPSFDFAVHDEDYSKTRCVL
jgi:hypothetical protein